MSSLGVGTGLHSVEDMSSLDKLDNYFKALAVEEGGSLNSIPSDPHRCSTSSLDSSHNTSDAEDEAHYEYK